MEKTKKILESLPDFARQNKFYFKAGIDESGNSSEDPNSNPLEEAPVEKANLIGSRVNLPGFAEEYHLPLLDIDFPVAVIPSSTEGHGHLYLAKILTKEQYTKLLTCLRELGIIEEGIKNQMVTEGQTCLRLPHIKKPQPTQEEEELSW